MATRNDLKQYFQTGDKPTEAQFAALIDAVMLAGDQVAIDVIAGLSDALAARATASQVNGINDRVAALEIGRAGYVLSSLDTTKYSYSPTDGTVTFVPPAEFFTAIVATHPGIRFYVQQASNKWKFRSDVYATITYNAGVITQFVFDGVVDDMVSSGFEITFKN